MGYCAGVGEQLPIAVLHKTIGDFFGSVWEAMHIHTTTSTVVLSWSLSFHAPPLSRYDILPNEQLPVSSQ